MLDTSKKYSLSKESLYKALRGLFVIICGGVLTYLVQVIAQTDFGSYELLATGVLSTVIELGRRFLTDYAKQYDIPLNIQK